MAELVRNVVERWIAIRNNEEKDIAAVMDGRVRKLARMHYPWFFDPKNYAGDALESWSVDAFYVRRVTPESAYEGTVEISLVSRRSSEDNEQLTCDVSLLWIDDDELDHIIQVATDKKKADDDSAVARATAKHEEAERANLQRLVDKYGIPPGTPPRRFVTIPPDTDK